MGEFRSVLKRLTGLGFTFFALASPLLGQTAARKPNIVIIWGDDIGQSDVSAYSMGLMGFRTPNIDRTGSPGKA